MHPDLDRLIQLQAVETGLRKAEAELSEVPQRRAAAEAALAEERRRLDAVREGLAASQKARRQSEGELQDLEARRSKYKGQLMDVKTNKEYTAMLHEIEAVEREIRSREDQVLAEMERAESLGAETRREEDVFKQAEQRHRSEVRSLEEQGRTLEAEVGRLRVERDAVAATVSEERLALFQRVAKLRGSGVAEARDSMCQVCHVKLRPQFFMDLKRNEEIVQCPACNRILFYSPPVPVTVPEP